MKDRLREKHTTLNDRYTEYEHVVEDLQTALLEHLPELQDQLNLEFVQVQRVRMYLEDKGTLFRFLRRSAYDIDAAFDAMLATIQWRIEEHIDSLSASDLHPACLESGLFFFHRVDRFGRPYAVFNLREYRRDANGPSLNDFKRAIVFHSEVARRLMHEWSTREEGKVPVLQYTVLLDLKGAGISDLDFELGRFMMDLAKRQFPSSVAAIFVLNYGWMYASIWQFLKRILPQEALGRIIFPSQEELIEYFDPDDVLTEHGGNDDYVYDVETCAAISAYGRPAPILPMPRLPLSRAASCDSMYELFYSAHGTPAHSRPGTPIHSRPSTPLGSRPSSPALFEHSSMLRGLRMTPSDKALEYAAANAHARAGSPTATRLSSRHHTPSHSPSLRYTPMNDDVSSLASNHLQVPSHNQFNQTLTPAYIQLKQLYETADADDSDPHHLLPIPKIHHSQLLTTQMYRLIRLQRRIRLHFSNVIRRFVARRVSGVFWLVMVVVLRGGLINEVLRMITEHLVIASLTWSASTTTALTTAALHAALGGRFAVGGQRFLQR